MYLTAVSVFDYIRTFGLEEYTYVHVGTLGVQILNLKMNFNTGCTNIVLLVLFYMQ